MFLILSNRSPYDSIHLTRLVESIAKHPQMMSPHQPWLSKILFLFLFNLENLINLTLGAWIRAHIEWTEQPEWRHGGEQLQEDPHNSYSGLS